MCLGTLILTSVNVESTFNINTGVPCNWVYIANLFLNKYNSPDHLFHMYMIGYIYVTGFWKTNWIVTLGLFHFIGPADGYTCTLHIHSVITRLGWLVCFSRGTFADPVNSRLRQWDPWRALYGRHWSKIHPMQWYSETSMFRPMAGTSGTHS